MTDITFDHVMVTLMNIETNHHTYKLLQDNCLSSAYDIICLTDELLDCLVTDDVDDNGNTIEKDKPIPLYHRTLIRLVGDFFRWTKKKNNRYLLVSDILASTKQQWTEYLMDVPDKKYNTYSDTTTNHYKECIDWYKGNHSTQRIIIQPKYDSTVQIIHPQTKLQQTQKSIGKDMKMVQNNCTPSNDRQRIVYAQPKSENFISTPNDTVVINNESITKENDNSSSLATSGYIMTDRMKVVTQQFQQSTDTKLDVNVYATHYTTSVQDTNINSKYIQNDSCNDIHMNNAKTDCTKYIASRNNPNSIVCNRLRCTMLSTKVNSENTFDNMSSATSDKLMLEADNKTSSLTILVNTDSNYNNQQAQQRTDKYTTLTSDIEDSICQDVDNTTKVLLINTITATNCDNSTIIRTNNNIIDMPVLTNADYIKQDNTSCNNTMESDSNTVEPNKGSIYHDSVNKIGILHIKSTCINTGTVEDGVHETLLSSNIFSHCSILQDSITTSTRSGSEYETLHSLLYSTNTETLKVHHLLAGERSQQSMQMLYLWYPRKLLNHVRKYICVINLHEKFILLIYISTRTYYTIMHPCLNSQCTTDGEIDTISHSSNEWLIQSKHNKLNVDVKAGNMNIADNQVQVDYEFYYPNTHGLITTWKEITMLNDYENLLVDDITINHYYHSYRGNYSVTHALGALTIRVILSCSEYLVLWGAKNIHRTYPVEATTMETIEVNVDDESGNLDLNEHTNVTSYKIMQPIIVNKNILQNNNSNNDITVLSNKEYLPVLDNENDSIIHSTISNRSIKEKQHIHTGIYKGVFYCSTNKNDAPNISVHTNIVDVEVHDTLLDIYRKDSVIDNTDCDESSDRIHKSSPDQSVSANKKEHQSFVDDQPKAVYGLDLRWKCKPTYILDCILYDEFITLFHINSLCWHPTKLLKRMYTLCWDGEISISLSQILLDFYIWKNVYCFYACTALNYKLLTYGEIDCIHHSLTDGEIDTYNNSHHKCWVQSQSNNLEVYRCYISYDTMNLYTNACNTWKEITTLNDCNAFENIEKDIISLEVASLGTLVLVTNKHATIIAVGTKVGNHSANYDISSMFHDSGSIVGIDVNVPVTIYPMLDHIAVSIIVLNTLHDPVPVQVVATIRTYYKSIVQCDIFGILSIHVDNTTNGECQPEDTIACKTENGTKDLLQI